MMGASPRLRLAWALPRDRTPALERTGIEGGEHASARRRLRLDRVGHLLAQGERPLGFVVAGALGRVARPNEQAGQLGDAVDRGRTARPDAELCRGLRPPRRDAEQAEGLDALLPREADPVVGLDRGPAPSLPVEREEREHRDDVEQRQHKENADRDERLAAEALRRPERRLGVLGRRPCRPLTSGSSSQFRARDWSERPWSVMWGRGWWPCRRRSPVIRRRGCTARRSVRRAPASARTAPSLAPRCTPRATRGRADPSRGTARVRAGLRRRA